jgi:heme-degrading monooxygenase HmoA
MHTQVSAPSEPYYAVIFTSQRTEGDNGYELMSSAIEKLAMQQPGFLGIESARSGIGITVSYWDSMESILAWKNVAAHRAAQQSGREKWYSSYQVRVCKVEREYSFNI